MLQETEGQGDSVRAKPGSREPQTGRRAACGPSGYEEGDGHHENGLAQKTTSLC